MGGGKSATWRSSASLSALLNAVGSVGGARPSTITASIAVHRGWSHALGLAALITVCSGLLFSLVNAGRNMEQSSSERGLPIESSV